MTATALPDTEEPDFATTASVRYAQTCNAVIRCNLRVLAQHERPVDARVAVALAALTDAATSAVAAATGGEAS